ncbi:MAG: hypothetical protein H6641_21510 [Caldilineaceae bacterium]|nr:hypothetical protein [Caldilineaceae bacterium]
MSFQPQGFSQSRLREDIFAVLKHWQDPNVTPSTLTQLHLANRVDYQAGDSPNSIVTNIINSGLEVLNQQEQRMAQLIRLRYFEGASVIEVCNVLNVAESTLYSLQKNAIDRLTQVILDLENQLRQEMRIGVERRLEAPTYTQLIGVETWVERLVEIVTQPSPPWIISIEGIGGIGKTALADRVMRHCIAHTGYSDFGWATARQENLRLDGSLQKLVQPLTTIEQTVGVLVAQLTDVDPLYTSLDYHKKLAYLEDYLNQTPSIIAIDNLETLEDLKEWLPLLRRLTQPTKFILTSRSRLHSEAGIYHFSVPELSETDAFKLLRHEATVSNLPLVAAATDDLLQPIFSVVGGNPLALRLVVGQLNFHNFDQVLADLTMARGKKAETLYRFIYQNAWENLDESARQIWLLMPLWSESSATLENLTEFSGLSIDKVQEALEQLTLQNLINCSGTLYERRYSLHSLTRSFLHEQVARWQ